MQNVHEIYERYLKGECSQEELVLLLRYFREHGDDPILVQRIEEVLQRSVPDEVDSPHVESVLRENHGHIIGQIREENNPRPRFVARTYRYAAAVAVLFFIVGLVLYKYGLKLTSEAMDMADTETIIQPGGNRATITLADGQVLELSEDQDGFLSNGDDLVYADGSTISSLEEVQTVVLSTPRAGQYTVTLSDGTRVWLNAASEIVYPSRFDGDERIVELKGEAYFDVARDDSKPFVVYAAQQRIEVLGTQFNIQAYGDGDIQRTTLVSGAVSVANPATEENIRLKPGQQAQSDSQGVLRVRQVDTDEYVSWKDGIILLNSYGLTEIVQQLERWYDVEFGAIPKKVKTVKVFGMLQRDVPLNDVLNTLSDNYNVQFKIDERRIMILSE